MANVRRPVFSGSWYPRRAGECEREIRAFLKDTSMRKAPEGVAVGGIVPHAGWYFSGSIACNVVNHLSQGGPVDVYILFGMHLHPGSPSYIMKEGAWETPFGKLPVEASLATALAKEFSFQVETPENFVQDNTIELQLPFIKYFSSNASIVPMGVPPTTDSLDIGRKAAQLAKSLGLKAKVIGSTDLTHYGPNYGFSPKGSGASAVQWVRNENDRQIINLMAKMEAEKVIETALDKKSACCPGAAATAIVASKELGAVSGEILAYTTSYDKQPNDSFVGYTGILYYAPAAD